MLNEYYTHIYVGKHKKTLEFTSALWVDNKKMKGFHSYIAHVS